MSKNTIEKTDWHAEALDFCKTNGIHPSQITLAQIEKAIRRGAEIMATSTLKSLRIMNEELERKQKDSRPHDHGFKPLNQATN